MVSVFDVTSRESYTKASSLYAGEASFAPLSSLRTAWEPVAADLQAAIVPKAGHWLVRKQQTILIYMPGLTGTDQGDENPAWSAQKAIEFFGNSSNIPSIDLSWLENTYTMFGEDPHGRITPGTNESAV